jgi:hypothetical protein
VEAVKKIIYKNIAMELIAILMIGAIKILSPEKTQEGQDLLIYQIKRKDRIRLKSIIIDFASR